MTITLPPIRAFRKFSSHDNAWADHYGALHVAGDYCGLKLPDGCAVKGLWQHGVFGPWAEHTPRLLAYNAPGGEQRVTWVAREEQAALLRANGYADARAVGMPILYTRGGDLPRQPGSLLVMPGHAIGGWTPTDRTPYERYADEITAMALRFDHVAVCISPRDRQSGLWVKEFNERGFTIIDGATTSDANALIRIRMLCEQYETITTNGWGSHVAYALAFGAKVSICGTLPTIDSATVLRLDTAWRANPTALVKARSSETAERERTFLKEFYVSPDAAVGNRKIGEWLIGSSHRVSPGEMRALLPRMIEFPSAKTTKSAPATGAPCGDLAVVLVRSHEFNYSETFVEDHVNLLTKNLTLLYGYPFPRFVKGGRSVLTDAFEQKLKLALSGAITFPQELWQEYSEGLAAFFKSCGAKSALVETGLMGAFVHEACERVGLPYVVHFHGMDAYAHEMLSRWKGHYHAFFKTASALVVVSEAMKTQLISLGAPADQVVLGPYGVAVDVERLAEPAKAGAQFIAVGRFVEKKAPQLTLQAFAAVHREVSSARLVMIGDGPLLGSCQQWARDNGIGDAVTFAGVQSREEVSRRMAASGVFVQHSITASSGDSEGLPLAVLEAGAHGLPVIATVHAGIPDAVRDGVDGLLVAEKDVKSMGAAMLRLARDPAQAANLGASLRKRIVARFTRQQSLARLLAVLQTAAKINAPKPSPIPVNASVHNVSAVRTEQPAQTGPQHVIANDRNNRAAYLKMGQTFMKSGALADAYRAIGEAHRLGDESTETRELLDTLEEQGALGEPAVELYRRRAGWLARRKSAKPRRILIVTNLLPPQEMGGYGRTMWEFSRELQVRGHTVLVYTADMPHLLRKGSPEHEAFEPNVRRTLRLYGDWKEGAAVVEPDVTKRKEIVTANYHTVLGAVQDFRPDVVMAGNLDFLGHFWVQEILNQGIPVLHRLGNANPGYESKHTPQSPLYCIAGCSEWVNENVRSSGYAVSRFAVVPPGSPLSEYFRAFPPQREQLRIAFASLLMPYKGAHVLLEALAYLQKLGVDFQCTLAGDSTSEEYLQKLRAFANDCGFLERLKFPGFLAKKELAALYAKSNVLVFPSVFEEPFGKTQIEAMAAGLLVVSSGNGGARDIICDGENGLFFKNADARDLAEKLLGAHRNPHVAEKIASTGQADAFRFTTAASVDRLETLLQELKSAADRERAKAQVAPSKFGSPVATVALTNK